MVIKIGHGQGSSKSGVLDKEKAEPLVTGGGVGQADEMGRDVGGGSRNR